MEKLECIHEPIEDDGMLCCSLCGQLLESFDFKAEWKSGTDSTSARCQFIGSAPEKGSIELVLSKLNVELTASQKKDVSSRYKKIVGDKTLRGKTRRAIIAACMMFAFRDAKITVTQDQLRKEFRLTKKRLSDGISQYNRVFPESRGQNVTVLEMIRGVISKVKKHHPIQVDERDALDIMKKLYSIDRNFKHSNPANSAAAVVYYLIEESGYKLSRSTFTGILGQTDASISNLHNIAKQHLSKE